MTNTVLMVPTDETEFTILVPKTIHLTTKVKVLEGKVILQDNVPMLEHADTIAGAFFMRALHTLPEAIERGWVRVLDQEEVTLTTTRKL